MLNIKFKMIFAVTLVLTLFLGLNMISASDVNFDNTVSLTDNNIKITSSNIDIDDVVEEINNNENVRTPNTNAGRGQVVKNGNNVLNFSSLNETINSGEAELILLDNDYTYDNSTDSRFKDLGGIVISRNLTIDGQGHNIDLKGALRFLNVTGYSINLKNLNITNGYGGNGGALYISNGNGNFENCLFTDNNASNTGGAVFIEEGNGNFENCLFTANNATDDSGAVHIDEGFGSFINCNFTANSAEYGGAVYIEDGNGSFTNCSFDNNSADYGGAVYLNNSNGTFTNCSLAYNHVNGSGGAGYIKGICNFENCLFTNNNATEYGGALCIIEGIGHFANSSFSFNNASYVCGGVCIEDGDGSFANCSFTNNSNGAVIIYGNGSFTDCSFTFHNGTSGSAVFLQDGLGSFINCSFSNNTGAYGSAVYILSFNVDYVYCSFTNCSFSNNNASNKGGAVYIDSAHGSFTNCSFSDNNANYGGAVYIKGDKSFAKFINSSFNYNLNPVYTTSKQNVIFDQNTLINSDKNLTNNTLYMNASVNNFTYGPSGFINITLFNDERIVSEGVVFVIISNKTFAANVSDNNALIYLPNVDCGVHEVYVVFNGTDNYFQTYVPVNFTVNKQSTSINAKATTYIVNYGGLYRVIFNPKIAGFKVSFKIKGINIGHAITDASGIAKINIKASALKKIGAGTHTLVALFAGDKNHIESKANVKIKIYKEATKFLNVKSIKKYYKSTSKYMQLTAALKNSKNKAIKNQIVYFNVNNKKTFKVKTNSKGVAKLTLNLAKIKACRINKKGIYRFKVAYKTSKTYKQSTKNGLIRVLK